MFEDIDLPTPSAPCIFRSCLQSALRQRDVAQPLLPFGENNYSEECAKHELSVVVDSEEVHRQIRRALEFKTVHRGRALSKDIPSLGLKKNDRLEPTADLLDVTAFDSLKEAALPVVVCFFLEAQPKEA